VGGVPEELAHELRDRLGLRRAIETGTYGGGGTRTLAGMFETVVTIELSHELHVRAREALADLANVTLLEGDSRELLAPLAEEPVPTLYWLDGHWSGGPTAGVEAECPLLDEIAAIGAGHRDDCLLIDDARLFAAAPPPPHDPAQWPTLVEVFDALRATRPDHHVTVLHDLVIAVPGSAKEAVDDFGRRPLATPQPPPQTVAARLGAAVARRLNRD
jgi:hypothetical protein